MINVAMPANRDVAKANRKGIECKSLCIEKNEYGT
jgi:hypothetical protein